MKLKSLYESMVIRGRGATDKVSSPPDAPSAQLISKPVKPRHRKYFGGDDVTTTIPQSNSNAIKSSGLTDDAGLSAL